MAVNIVVANKILISVVENYDITETAVVSTEGIFPFNAGVTGVVNVAELPSDFCISKYEYEEGQLVRLPDPEPAPTTKTEAQKLLAELDKKFDPRWFEDLVTGSPMHDRYVAWSSRREELREIIRNG
jgi:hypothetical protein